MGDRHLWTCIVFLSSRTSEVQKYQSNPGKIQNPIHALKVRLFNTCELSGTNLGTWNINMRKTNSLWKMAVYPSIISLNRAQTFKAPWQEVLVSHWHQVSVLSHFCASDHGVPTWNTLALLHLPKSSLPSKLALVPLLLETLITISSQSTVLPLN